MGRLKKQIPIEELGYLYTHENLSPAKIAEKYNCSSVTVRNRLLESGLPLRTKSAAQTKYPKHSFSGSNAERAYMLGFRYGDLNVYQPKATSEVVVVRCHTTHEAQEEVFEQLFGKYGRITKSRNSRSVHLNCYLDLSFLFLLDKDNTNTLQWISTDDALRWSFAAGYIDAEGTFGLNQGKGRFKVDAYDMEIIFEMHELFIKYGINSKLRIIARKGENDYGWVWKKDLWRVSVNEAQSLEKVITLLLPYLTHKKRRKDCATVLQNISQRRKNGTIT